MDGFRAAAEVGPRQGSQILDLKTMQAEQGRFTARQQQLGACDDAVSMWRHPDQYLAAVRDMDGKALRISSSIMVGFLDTVRECGQILTVHIADCRGIFDPEDPPH